MDKRKKIADTHHNAPDTAIYTQPTPLTGAETVWATLVGEGRARCLRLSRWRDSSCVRCAAQISDPAHSGSP